MVEKKFSEELAKWERQLFCLSCWTGNVSTLVYCQTTKENEIWICKLCRQQKIISLKPIESDFKNK